MMKKRFLLLSALLFLAACVTSEKTSPWERVQPMEAAQAPRVLAPGAAAPAAAAPYGQPSYAQRDFAAVAVPPPGAAGTGMPPSGGFFPPPGQGAASATGVPADPAHAAPVLPPVRVALLVPLSGKGADLGQQMLRAAQLALFDMGYDAFELMPRDTKGTPEGARAAAREAVDAGAQLVLGPLFAGEVSAAKPVTAARGINMIAFSTDWTLAGGNTYIMGFLPFAQVERVAAYAAAHGVRTVGVLAPEDTYGSAVSSFFGGLAYRLGLRVVKNASFPPGQADISGTISAFSGNAGGGAEAPAAPAPFDAVFLPVGGEKARAVAGTLSYYNLPPGQVKRLGTGLWDDASLAVEPAMAGAWFAASSPNLRAGFERRYTDLYGRPPARLSTLAYDATALAAVLARNGHQTAGAPDFGREGLTNPNGFAGIDGIFRFRPDGLVERGLAVMEYSRSSIRVIDPAPSTFQGYGGL